MMYIQPCSVWLCSRDAETWWPERNTPGGKVWLCAAHALDVRWPDEYFRLVPLRGVDSAGWPLGGE